MELTRKELRQRLEIINAGLIAYCPELNCGGCVHFAYYLTKKLKELDIKSEVVLCDNYPLGTADYKHLHPVNHVMVYIEDFGYVDGHNIYSSTRHRYRRKYKFSLKKLDYYRNMNGWNEDYDTTDNRKIEYFINKHL